MTRESFFYLLQRSTALLLAPMVIIHMIGILYAVGGGLTGAEILARTQGNLGITLFYGLFVILASLHAPLGLRNIMGDWTKLPSIWIDRFAAAFCLLFLVFGLRSVWAVS